MARFEIVEGEKFDTTFVLKENGTTTPITLVGTETAEFILATLDKPITKVLTKPMTLGTLANGEFNLSLTALETTGLTYEIGFKEDGAKFKATYRANINIFNGDGSVLAQAQIPQVFIVYEGA